MINLLLKSLIRFGAAAALVFASRLFWPDMESYTVPALIIAAVIFGFGLYRFLKYRHLKTRRQHFQIWLEFLSARLAAGSTAEDAILKSPEAIAQMIGKKSALTVALNNLESRLQNHVELSLALEQFKSDFPLRDSEYIIDLLPYLRERGGRIDNFVRKSHRSLTAAIYTENEVRAEQSGKSSEATVLCVLPFLFSWAMSALDSPFNRTAPPATGNYGFVYALLFVLAWFAAAAVLLINHIPEQKLRALPTKVSEQGTVSRFALAVASVLHRFLPAQIGFTLARNARQLYPAAEHPYAHHVAAQLRAFGILLIPAIAVAALTRSPWFISIPFIVWAVRDFALISRARDLNTARESRYPAFINALAILLQSGLTVETGLRLLRNTGLSDPLLSADLDAVLREADSGVPISLCLNRWANTMPPNEINSALMLIARYEMDGSAETLALVMLHAENSWRLYRQAQRRRLQRRAMLYLVPMGIDLIVIMTLSILPSLTVFQM